jgi:O-antigen ligase
MNYKLWFLSLLLLQLLFLPGRYYVDLNNFFWPFPYTLIILFCFVLFILITHFARVTVNKKDNLHLKHLFPIIISILLMLTLQLLSLLINSPNSMRSPVDILIYFVTFYGPMPILFLTYTSVNSFNDVVRLIRIFMIVVSLAIIFAILFAVSDTLFGFVQPSGNKLFMHRMFIPRLGVTGFALLLSVSLPLIFSMYFFTKRKIYMSLFVTTVIALFFTFARWNMIVAVVTILVYVALLQKTIHPKKIWRNYNKKIFITACLLIILLLSLVDIESLRFFLGLPSASIDRSSSLIHRKMAFVQALSFFSERPLLGYGPGEIYVRPLSQAQYRIENPAGDFLYDFGFLSPYNIILAIPHSTVASILAEGGIVIFFAFIFILKRLIGKQIKNLKLIGDYKIIGVGSFAASFAFIFSMVFSNFDNVIETSILFWFIQGIGMGLYKLRCLSNLTSDCSEPA